MVYRRGRRNYIHIYWWANGPRRMQIMPELPDVLIFCKGFKKKCPILWWAFVPFRVHIHVQIMHHFTQVRWTCPVVSQLDHPLFACLEALHDVVVVVFGNIAYSRHNFKKPMRTHESRVSCASSTNNECFFCTYETLRPDPVYAYLTHIYGIGFLNSFV